MTGDKVLPFRKLPVGLRNANPLNIEYSTSNRWLGLDEPPTDGRFCRFTDPVYGIRAGCVLIRTYRRRYGLDTIAALIGRWAPPHENDSDSYASNVARFVGVTPLQKIDPTDPAILRPMLRAMVRQECGYCPFSDEQIDKAMMLAGIRVSRRGD